MDMRRIAFVLLVVFSLDAEAQRRRSVSRIPLVPAAYLALYQGLDSGLDQWNAYLDTRAPKPGHTITFGAELITANTNRGSALLNSGALPGVRLFLDRLQEMDVEAASISIGYPMLDPSFPRSEEYLAFYREVAREVRQRNMRLHVETGVVFAGTAFSDLDVDFSNLTLPQYIAGKRTMADLILEHLRPDFLGLGGEPDTEASLTGLQQLNDPETYANVISEVLSGLDKRGAVIGAGVGTWSPLEFAQRLVAIQGLDAITIHIYPIWRTAIENATLISALARENDKQITMDEAWLYKAVPSEATSVAANEAIFKRDAFDFWSPLDMKFLSVITKLARVEGISYVSPFWSTLFFGTIPWSPQTDAMPYSAVVQRLNEVAVANLVAGRRTELGDHYAMLIRATP